MPDRTRARTRKLLPWGCITTGLALIATILLWPVLARASSPAQLCEAAAQRAARAHDVPLDVMRAIAIVETGRNRDGQMTPWPWAIHAQGRGHWLPTRDAALALVRETLATGRRNIDLGCFQVNWHWHGHEFTTLEDMIDPAQNADYAARLLRGHKARLGRWDLAAGAYHSATPEHATRYIARFTQARKTLGPTAPAPQVTPAENRFALLQAGGRGARGSVVPQALMTGGARLIDLEHVQR
jgi:hypothetical protein